jgi:hypothetical protein
MAHFAVETKSFHDDGAVVNKFTHVDAFNCHEIVIAEANHAVLKLVAEGGDAPAMGQHVNEPVADTSVGHATLLGVVGDILPKAGESSGVRLHRQRISDGLVRVEPFVTLVFCVMAAVMLRAVKPAEIVLKYVEAIVDGISEPPADLYPVATAGVSKLRPVSSSIGGITKLLAAALSGVGHEQTMHSKQLRCGGAGYKARYAFSHGFVGFG